MRPGRFRQGVERALTAFAAVAGHSARLAPTHDGAAVALGPTGAVDAALPKAQPQQPLQPGSIVAPPAMPVRPALCLAWPPCQRLRCSGSTGCAFRCHRCAKPRTRRAPAMLVAAAAQSGPQSRPARTQTPPRPWWLSLVTDTCERPQQVTLQEPKDRFESYRAEGLSSSSHRSRRRLRRSSIQPGSTGGWASTQPRRTLMLECLLPHRIGGGYCNPPFDQILLIPRGTPIGVIFRSHISPRLPTCLITL